MIEFAKELAELNEDVILTDLGFYTDSRGDIQCSCPIHNGDNNTAFSYKSSRKIWRCWTHKCHEQYGGDLIGLIRSVKNVSLKEAIQYILTFDDGTKIHGSPEIRKFIKENRREDEVYDFDASTLHTSSKHTPYFLNRGLNQSILNDFQAFEYKTREYFPIITDDNKILGCLGRLTETSPDKPKWKFFPHHLPKSTTLFGIHIAKDYIGKSNTVILVEGPFDVVNLHQHGFKNAVATMGTGISIEQIKLLLKYGAHRVIIAYDPDSAGIEASEDMVKKLSLYFKITNKTSELPKDPGGLTKIEVEQYFGTV
jgi:5S rRNA maturation endonuclease (ribonuclease M5)